MTGDRILLLPCEDEHLSDVYRIVSQPMNSQRWRFHGAEISRDEFLASMRHETLGNFVVVERTTGRVVGFAATYGVSMRHQYGYIGIVVDEDQLGAGVGAEVGILLITHLFETYPLRKLYMEIPEFTVPSVEDRMGDAFEREGVLAKHIYLMGAYWDVHVFATYRRTWINGTPKFGVGSRPAMAEPVLVTQRQGG